MDNKRLTQLRGGDISMIFQDPMTSLNPTMKIGNQIIEALKIHRNMSGKEAKDEAAKLLDIVQIPEAREETFSISS